MEHDFENEIGDALPPPETFDDDAFRRSYDLDYGEVEDCPDCGAPRGYPPAGPCDNPVHRGSGSAR